MKSQWQKNLEHLYQQSRVEYPPAELEQKIRKAALTSIQNKKNHFSWYLSTAAVFLLCVNVVLLTYYPQTEDVEIRSKSTADQTVDRSPAVKGLPETPAPAKELSSDTDYLRQKSIMQKREVLHDNKETDNGALSRFSSDQASTVVETEEAPAKPATVTPAVLIPRFLPFNLKQLMEGHEGLSGDQGDNSLNIYRAGKRLLSISRQHQGLTIQAYQGAELWGIHANWGQSAANDSECLSGDFQICDLNSQVKGGFKNNQLVFIRWEQADES